MLLPDNDEATLKAWLHDVTSMMLCKPWIFRVLVANKRGKIVNTVPEIVFPDLEKLITTGYEDTQHECGVSD
jgi:hypothetical protein